MARLLGEKSIQDPLRRVTIARLAAGLGKQEPRRGQRALRSLDLLEQPPRLCRPPLPKRGDPRQYGILSLGTAHLHMETLRGSVLLRQLPLPRERVADDRVQIVQLRPPGQ